MATINGISVKGMKKFFGHEGEPCFQGNLYLENKKIGTWSQDSWGGCDNFYIEKSYSERLLNKAVVSLNLDKEYRGGTAEKPFVLEYNLERLLDDYISLVQDEKEYKKAVKAGYAGVMILSDGYHLSIWRLGKRLADMTDDELAYEMRHSIENAKKSFFKEDKFNKHTLKIYRSLTDFEVGKPIEFADIIKK